MADRKSLTHKSWYVWCDTTIIFILNRPCQGRLYSHVWANWRWKLEPFICVTKDLIHPMGSWIPSEQDQTYIYYHDNIHDRIYREIQFTQWTTYNRDVRWGWRGIHMLFCQVSTVTQSPSNLHCCKLQFSGVAYIRLTGWCYNIPE